MLTRKSSYGGKKRARTSGGGGGGASFTQIAAGARIARAYRQYKSYRRAKSIVKRQITGRGTVMPFHRTIYSNYEMASGLPRQAIYLQTGTSPFRILNTGSGNFENADSFSIWFTALNMNITWWQGAVQQDIYTYRLPDMSELFRLYDQMQLSWVEIEFFYGNNSADYQGATSAAPPGDPTRTIFGHPLLLYAKDYDDALDMGATPINVIAQYENHKCWQMGAMPENANHIIRIRPKFNLSGPDGGGGTAGVIQFSDSRKLWLDTTDGQAIPHYGIKGTANLISTVQQASPAQTYILGVLGFRATFHFNFKNVK